MNRPEAALGKQVVAWLQRHDFECYQEVDAHVGVADIAATCDGLLVIVELKVSLTFTVIAQAIRWRPYAHHVYVAVPQNKTALSEGQRLAYRVCEDRGVGVAIFNGDERNIRIVSAPAINRRALTSKIKLCEEQKTYEAGAPTGARWTPFKATCRALLDRVTREPGVTLKAALDGLEHHYASPASARATMHKRIAQGVVPGVRCERDGRAVKLWPVGGE